jgi:hypothetical protein
MFKEPFFDHLVGAIAQHFIDIVIVTEQIEQAIRAGKIVNPTKNKGFTGKKKNTNLNNLEKRSYHNSYQEPFFISNVNFFNPFLKNQTNTPNNQQNTPTERTFHPKNDFY